ncbi:hypothetical protein L1987_58655 [Smallanthus sonchifolius]|uniref:Uncharacterized protein n=1 Tax=Smallanthus sonchifolius TaxID=185202 RepID=A0ACB9DGY9_9ASTR|nr:hypothetical protein L1987_58655 [Smallanthus sonchifolius]
MGFRVLLSVVVLASCLMMNVLSDEVDDNVSWTQSPHHAPSYQPVAAPAPHHHKLAIPPTSHAPVQPPSKAPVQPPAPLPARKLVAIQGVVYCKACKYKGIDTLIGAKPLQGAEVLLTCNNTKYPLRVKGTTDKNGYFFIKPPKTLTTYGSHRCRVSLLTSPTATCNQPTDLHAGVKGSLLLPNKKPPLSLPYDVFSVGPFAFEPSSKTPCAHED